MQIRRITGNQFKVQVSGYKAQVYSIWHLCILSLESCTFKIRIPIFAILLETCPDLSGWLKKSLETCSSGWRGTPGKCVYGKPYQGFESLGLRWCNLKNFTLISFKAWRIFLFTLVNVIIWTNACQSISMEWANTLRRKDLYDWYISKFIKQELKLWKEKIE